MMQQEEPPFRKRIPYREYLGNRECLPKMYRKYLAMLDALVYRDELTGPAFSSTQLQVCSLLGQTVHENTKYPISV